MSENMSKSNVDEDLHKEIRYSVGPWSLEELDSKFPSRPQNAHPTLPFHELFMTLFNPLNENRNIRSGPLVKKRKHGPKSLSPHEQRAIIIQRFITRWRAKVGNDFFPAIRLILPGRDRDRVMYGIRENAIAKILIKVLRIDRHSEDASSLLNWRLPGQKKANPAMVGDFASRCYEVLSKRSMKNKPGDMRIAEVNELLDQLSMVSKEAEQVQIFDKFYRRMNAEEFMWLIRIILRDMRIGATEKTILDLWHPDGEALFNVCSSLRRVCWELTDPTIRLENEMTGVTVMEPFQPQLAQFHTHDFQRVIKKLGCTIEDKEFWIEEKLDGERMQLHMVQDQSIPGGFRFCFWSRNGKEYTYLYGKGFEDKNSSLTRFIRTAFGENIKSIILDGEMITWDPKTNKIVAFGTLKSAALSEQQDIHDDGLGNRPLFKVFDCLYVNGRNITQYILRERRKVLEKALKNVGGRIEIHEYLPATTTDQIEEELRKVVAESSEGLVLKNPRSAYRLNSRNDDWVKVKPEYMAGFGESLDCVVIGGYYGRGHRSGALGSFLCGLRVDKNHIDKGAHPMKCYSFCKVGGGFSASDFSRIRQMTDGKWRDWDRKSPPNHLIVLGGGKRQFERPDQWISPDDSVVFEIKATSFVVSESFAVGFTLRFPRFKKLREDKSWKDALSIYEVLELKNRTEGEAKESEFQVERKKKRLVQNVKREVVIMGNEEKIEKAEPYTGPRTKAFDGLNFCILSEMIHPEKKSKVEIERIVKMNGGSIIQNPMVRENTICIGDKRVVRVASLIESGEIDIIKPIWIIDALQYSDTEDPSRKPFLPPFEPRHLFYATEKTKKLIKNSVDIYGDSYSRDITNNEIKDIMANMIVSIHSKSTTDLFRLLRFDNHERDVISKVTGWIFLGCRARFVVFSDNDQSKDGDNDNKDGMGNSDGNNLDLHLAYNYFQFSAGQIAITDDDENITHFISVNNSSLNDSSVPVARRSIDQHIFSFQRHCPTVTLKWLSDSWAQEKLLDEKDYILDFSSNSIRKDLA
ncbi:hypothetical protein EPUL_001727 [Erysiphe pulchra]|uniref:DNA ligase n=1 Tax=Erysiphe pulchra TaxID=225359 RepID=A0A2S4PU19_9PEZI|nr:hypothetical protein EPUL_001727 [Erysiphe pulchra]